MADLTAHIRTLLQHLKKKSWLSKNSLKLRSCKKALHAKTQGKTALMMFAVGDNWMPHAANDRFGFAYELSGI